VRILTLNMKFLLTLILFSCQTLFAQDLLPYKIYNDKGKEVSFKKMIQSLEGYDVVLFGELHNNAFVHWAQLRTLKALHAKRGSQLILGAEMFERDNQEGLDRYLKGEIDSKQLGEEVRLWKNYPTDYAPLVDFAKKEGLVFRATNVPRRYASEVARKGLDSLKLSDDERSYVVKLPFDVSLDTPGYQEMVKMVHSGANAMNFVAAQAIKDATMAESILQVWAPGKQLLHFHGDFHSKDFGGIYWYLKKARPELKVAVVSIMESEDADLRLPQKGTQFNLVIPVDMAKSY
jgi:uncharacterized iron-regulated protein